MTKTAIVPWPNPIKEQLINDKLGAFLGDKNDAKLFSEIAHAIDAPTCLHGFITALENFRSVMPSIVDYLAPAEAAMYSEQIRAIDALLKRINSEEVDADLLSKNHRNFCASNPLYALLLRSGCFKLRQDLCEQFVAQFYLNYIESWMQMSECLRTNAGLAMRSTSEGRGFDTAAFNEFQQILDPSEGNALIESLESFEGQYASSSLTTNKGEVQPASRQYIRTLIILFIGKLGKKKGGGGTRKGGGSRLADLPDNQNMLTAPAHAVDEEDEDETGLGNSRIHHDIGEEQRKSSLALGVAPGDSTSGIEAVTEEVLPNKSVAIATDKKRMKLRIAQIANAIAISNQFLPTQWGQLNTYDVYVLVRELMELSDRDNTKNGVSSPLLAASIASSFVRGVSLDCITKMKVVTKLVRGGDNHVLLRQKGNQWSAKWLVSGSIVSGRKSKADMVGLCRPIEDNKTVALEVPAWVAHLLGIAKIKRDTLGLANRQRILFPDTCGDYSLAAKKWLKKVRRKYPACRLTLNRIECYFVQCCMQFAKFDLAETAYCHNHAHLIQETQLYYTAVAKERIAYIYKQIWMQIDNLVQKENQAIKYTPPHLASSQQTSIGDYRNATAFLGSEITPTNKAVSSLVSFLKKKIDQAKATSPHWERTIAYHNAYTTYTILFLAYASGYRAAQDPFPDPRFLDEKTGFLVISDKDFDDSYCTRIIWLPPECAQQMKYYQAHIESVVDHLCLINKKSFNDLYASFDGWQTLPKRPKRKMRMDASEFERPAFLFYLNDTGECHPVSPDLISKKIHGVYPFPINANRHYLRTELVERRCPGDILDAFMGHWQQGREAWGKYSSLSPCGYSNEIGPRLKAMLQENEWHAIRSIEA